MPLQRSPPGRAPALPSHLCTWISLNARGKPGTASPPPPSLLASARVIYGPVPSGSGELEAAALNSLPPACGSNSSAQSHRPPPARPPGPLPALPLCPPQPPRPSLPRGAGRGGKEGGGGFPSRALPSPASCSRLPARRRRRRRSPAGGEGARETAGLPAAGARPGSQCGAALPASPDPKPPLPRSPAAVRYL